VPPITSQVAIPATGGTRLRAAAAAMVLIGLVTFAGLLVAGKTELAWSGLLQGMLVPTWIAMGGLFFIAVHSLCGGQWITPLRRIIEGLTAGLPLTLVAFLAIAVFGGPYLYDWLFLSGPAHDALFHPHAESHDLVTPQAWMSAQRWILTTAVILLVWLWFRLELVRLSLRQDGGSDISASHLRLSTVFLLVFALSFTLFCWDMLMALNSHWVSTMWGIYCFTSAVQTFLAVLIIIAVWLRAGPLSAVVREHTLRDLGTWMVAWACFTAYIGFAQFLVIYYANIDEETIFFIKRFQHGYGQSYVLEAVLRFAVPFAALMSQSMRARPAALVTVSALALLGNWIDWSWIIMPAFSPNHFRPFWDLPALLIGAGFVGAFLLLALAFWRKHGLVAKGDPRLQSTINAEHLH
jgi:hypothetical protein